MAVDVYPTNHYPDWASLRSKRNRWYRHFPAWAEGHSAAPDPMPYRDLPVARAFPSGWRVPDGMEKRLHDGPLSTCKPCWEYRLQQYVESSHG